MPQSAERLKVETQAEPAPAIPRKFFDEMREQDGAVRHAYAALAELLDGLSLDSLVTKQGAAEECSAGSALPSRCMAKAARPSG